MYLRKCTPKVLTCPILRNRPHRSPRFKTSRSYLYKHVLGLERIFQDTDHFWPKCTHSPAFLTYAEIAILPIEQYGEHFALNVSREEFSRAEIELPKLLAKHSVGAEACIFEKATNYHYSFMIWTETLLN